MKCLMYIQIVVLVSTVTEAGQIIRPYYTLLSPRSLRKFNYPVNRRAFGYSKPKYVSETCSYDSTKDGPNPVYTCKKVSSMDSKPPKSIVFKKPIPNKKFKPSLWPRNILQYQAPQVDYQHQYDGPVYDNDVPAYQYDEPEYGYDEPKYANNIPAYQYNEPAYQYNEPAYQTNKPIYQKNKPVYQYNEPAYQNNKPMYQYNEPAYEYNEPTYEYNEPTYEYNESVYEYNEPPNEYIEYETPKYEFYKPQHEYNVPKYGKQRPNIKRPKKPLFDINAFEDGLDEIDGLIDDVFYTTFGI